MLMYLCTYVCERSGFTCVFFFTFLYKLLFKFKIIILTVEQRFSNYFGDGTGPLWKPKYLMEPLYKWEVLFYFSSYCFMLALKSYVSLFLLRVFSWSPLVVLRNPRTPPSTL